MLEKCASCGSRMLGSHHFMDRKFCGEKCVARFQEALVDQVFEPEVVEQQIREAFEGPCPLCGQPGANDLYGMTKVTSFIIFFQVQTNHFLCCASCARSKRLKAAAHCFFAGWWGPKAFIYNLFLFPSNLISPLFIRSRQEPSPALIGAVKTMMAQSIADSQGPAPLHQSQDWTESRSNRGV